MLKTDFVRLAKIMALVDQGSAGEKLAALDRVTEILATSGHTLPDLVLRGLAAQNGDLPENDLSLLEAREDAANWRRIAEQHAAQYNRQQLSIQKWQALAQIAADRLWDLGRELELGAINPNAVETDTDMRTGEEDSVIPFRKDYRRQSI